MAKPGFFIATGSTPRGQGTGRKRKEGRRQGRGQEEKGEGKSRGHHTTPPSPPPPAYPEASDERVNCPDLREWRKCRSPRWQRRATTRTERPHRAPRLR